MDELEAAKAAAAFSALLAPGQVVVEVVPLTQAVHVEAPVLGLYVFAAQE
jgi:hypothetical protein